MEIGCHLPTQGPVATRDALLTFAREADTRGIAAGRLRKAADVAGRPFGTIELSLRFSLKDDLLAQGPQAVIDALAAYARVGCRHVMLEFRRDDLARMLEILEVITRTVRPALAAA